MALWVPPNTQVSLPDAQQNFESLRKLPGVGRGVPHVEVLRTSTTASFTSGVHTGGVNFDTLGGDGTDPWKMWNGAASVIVPIAGVYACSGACEITGGGTHVFEISFSTQGSGGAQKGVGQVCNGAGIANVQQNVFATRYLNAGDSVSLAFDQNSGATQTTVTASSYASGITTWGLSVTYVGPFK